MSLTPCSGVVLAAGRSSRMGRDKALLPWQGQTLLDQARRQLFAAGAGRVLTCGRSDHPDAIPDRERGQGPLSALAQLCPALDDGVYIVVPVDMPLLSTALLQLLACTEAACVAVEGNPLPMRLQLQQQVRHQLAHLDQQAGPQRSLRALQQALHARWLEAAPWQDQLRGCNTPDEWNALRDSRHCPPSDASN